MVLLALCINVSLESRKTQGTLPFSQPISKPFGRFLSQRNIEESSTHRLRQLLMSHMSDPVARASMSSSDTETTSHAALNHECLCTVAAICFFVFMYV